MTDERLTARQERALLAVLSHGSVVAACNACGVPERTVRHWMAEDEVFKSELARLRREAFETAVTQVNSSVTQAIDTLREVMEDRLAPPSARVAAAGRVLDIAFRAAETLDLSVRVAALEQAVGEERGQNHV